MKKKSEILHGRTGKALPGDTLLLNRRDLLKFAGITAGAALFPSVLPSPAQSVTAVKYMQGGTAVLINGTSRGQIVSSSDKGKSWKVNADFGVDCPVLSLRSSTRGFRAELDHKGHCFTLYSADGYHWRA